LCQWHTNKWGGVTSPQGAQGVSANIVSTFSHSIDDISGTCVFNRGTNKFLICVVSGNGTNTVGVWYESSMSLYV
jgi:hypothetical protein